MPRQYKYTIVACARWETEYLTEWLNYHRNIGFDHVYIYCNDDDPLMCHERLLPFISGPAPFVTFAYYPFVGLQVQMYRHFLQHRLQEVDWFIFLDVDEFLVLREDGNIRDFMARRQTDADMIVFNWLVFGHSGFKERPTGSVLLNYTWRSRYVSTYTKVLTRAQTLDVARYLLNGESGFWHDWNLRKEKLNRVLNVIGDDMTDYFGTEVSCMRRFLDDSDRHQRIISTAVIYHYQFRSEDEISRRLRRGVAGDFQGQLAFQKVLETGTLAEFLTQFSEIEDTSLRDYWRYVIDSAWNSSTFIRPKLINIALGKPATQSSRSPWSKGTTEEDDAAPVVGGAFTGSANCHTAEEDSPWWQVDLLDSHNVKQIRVFNRIDTQVFKERASVFALETSLDGKNWTNLYRTERPVSFGGTDGKPLIWWDKTGRTARYVRFRLLARAPLHIEAVEIYEQAHTPPAGVEPSNYGRLAERIANSSIGRIEIG